METPRLDIPWIDSPFFDRLLVELERRVLTIPRGRAKLEAVVRRSGAERLARRLGLVNLLKRALQSVR